MTKLADTPPAVRPARAEARSGAPRAVGARGLALAALAATVAALGLGWLPYVPPAARPATAPAGEFSAARALPHLQRIAQRPRPPGTAAHRDVQLYLQAQLRALGLEPSVQTTTVAGEARGRQNVAATVTNIAARLPGRGGSHQAILLVTHYDGVVGGPGANDAGVPVAALLETLRALRAGPPLRDDVIVLFTDGEESGLLGARAFSEAHPWAKDVRLVLNFDARGTRGPAMMFETSRGNGWLARGFARGADAPVGSSLFYEIYRLLPNDTDFSVFRRGGVAGMNFAYVGGLTGYHTRLDDLASVDARNVQHQGAYALGLARRFGAADLPARAGGDAVFFNVPLLGLVTYGVGWAVPLAAAAFLLLLVVIGRGVRARALRPGRTVLGFFGFLGMLVLLGVVLTGVWQLVRATHAAYAWMPMGETYNGALYFAAFVLLAVAFTGAAHRWARKRLTAAELLASALLAWGVMALAFGLVFPGGGYLWLWPTLSGAAGLWALLRGGAEPDERRLLAAGLGALPALLLMGPVVWLLYLGMTVQAVGLLMVLVALVLGLMLPHLELAQRAGGRAWLLAPALAAVVLLGVAETRSSFDARHPRPNSLFYVMDAARNQAAWASSDAVPDAWTSRFLGANPRPGPLSDYFPAVDYRFLRNAAPAVASPLPPRLQLLSDERRADGRVLRVRVTSQRGAEQVWVNVAPGTEIAASVNGRALGGGDRGGEPWSLRYVGLPAEGIELTLRVKGTGAVSIQAIDRTSGLPALPEVARNPRPAETMSTPILNTLQDATFMAATLVVPAA
ncbi:MAG TPA: M20/M25/M40 family metallo-hydrolase [Longimicrobium sp.]